MTDPNDYHVTGVKIEIKFLVAYLVTNRSKKFKLFDLSKRFRCSS